MFIYFRFEHNRGKYFHLQCLPSLPTFLCTTLKTNMQTLVSLRFRQINVICTRWISTNYILLVFGVTRRGGREHVALVLSLESVSRWEELNPTFSPLSLMHWLCYFILFYFNSLFNTEQFQFVCKDYCCVFLLVRQNRPHSIIIAVLLLLEVEERRDRRSCNNKQFR